MNNQTKLEFRLVPTKGVASGKGFRAAWTRKDDVIDMDAVLVEAQEPRGRLRPRVHHPRIEPDAAGERLQRHLLPGHARQVHRSVR